MTECVERESSRELNTVFAHHGAHVSGRGARAQKHADQCVIIVDGDERDGAGRLSPRSVVRAHERRSESRQELHVEYLQVEADRGGDVVVRQWSNYHHVSRSRRVSSAARSV